MVQNAFNKFLMGTDWGHLDVLVLDMPPGDTVQVLLLHTSCAQKQHGTLRSVYVPVSVMMAVGKQHSYCHVHVL